MLPWKKLLPNSDPKIGDVYYYPYIWSRQAPDDDAEKDRPCCVTLRLPAPVNGYDVILLALSKSGWPDDGDGIEVPKAEVARISGLSKELSCFLTISEVNYATHDFEYFDKTEFRGTFSPEFMKDTVGPRIIPLLEMVVSKMKAGKLP